MSFRPWSQADIETVRKLVADGASAREAGAAVGRDRDAVHALKKRHPEICFSRIGRNPLDAPAGFAAKWEKHSNRVLAEMYGRSSKTIQRWAQSLGLSRPTSWRSPEHVSKKAAKAVRPAKAPVAPKPKLVVVRSSAAPVDRPRRDMSPAGQAADYLRAFSAVYRCTPTGRADEKGTHWRRGNAVLTDAELIDRADWMRSRRAAA